MQYRFYTCDVFTDQRFGGNQLAVLPNADGLSASQMLQITREFNYSETTFVLPGEAGHARRVRIFTPAQEVPFAGHPNIGTAFVLATTGALGPIQSSLSVTFDEQAGAVPITIRESDGVITSCELQAPEAVTLGDVVPLRYVAAAASLRENAISTGVHPPQLVSVGLPFIFVELPDLETLQTARIHLDGFESLRDYLQSEIRASLYLYAREEGTNRIRARMFAPLSGVPEDPATGSAGCALAGLLAHFAGAADGEFDFRIEQGVEIGRPSVLLGRAAKSNGEVTTTWIAGGCVMVSEGFILVE